MRTRTVRLRIGAVLLLCAALAGASGCAELAGVGNYFQYRLDDLCEVADIGLTITTTPQWGFYWNSLEILLAGYSKVDGYFIGIGGGHFLLARHSNECYGLVMGVEKVGWSWNLDLSVPIPEENIHKRLSGIPGIFAGLSGGGEYGAGPNYTPACVHFFPHIGFVGLVWNLRYTEIIDFALGWFGLDISGDDGRQVGHWNIPGLTPPSDDSGAPADPGDPGDPDSGAAPGELSVR